MLHKCVLDGDRESAFDGDVWSRIDRLSEANEDVVLDFSGVDFIDSQGVGAIVSLIRRLSLKGLQLKVRGLQGQPLRLFLDLQLIPVSGVRQQEDGPSRSARGQASARIRSAATQASREPHLH